MILSDTDYSVTAFADSVSLVSSCRELRPLAILLDLCIPGTSGILILRQLRRMGCSSPVIVISGQADIGAAVEAMKAGAQDFLEKPFDRAELLGCLNEFCGKNDVAEIAPTFSLKF